MLVAALAASVLAAYAGTVDQSLNSEKPLIYKVFRGVVTHLGDTPGDTLLGGGFGVGPDALGLPCRKSGRLRSLANSRRVGLREARGVGGGGRNGWMSLHVGPVLQREKSAAIGCHADAT